MVNVRVRGKNANMISYVIHNILTDRVGKSFRRQKQ